MVLYLIYKLNMYFHERSNSMVLMSGKNTSQVMKAECHPVHLGEGIQKFTGDTFLTNLRLITAPEFHHNG
jgi:hypothetical protein